MYNLELLVVVQSLKALSGSLLPSSLLSRCPCNLHISADMPIFPAALGATSACGRQRALKTCIYSRWRPHRAALSRSSFENATMILYAGSMISGGCIPFVVGLWPQPVVHKTAADFDPYPTTVNVVVPPPPVDGRLRYGTIFSASAVYQGWEKTTAPLGAALAQ